MGREGVARKDRRFRDGGLGVDSAELCVSATNLQESEKPNHILPHLALPVFIRVLLYHKHHRAPDILYTTNAV